MSSSCPTITTLPLNYAFLITDPEGNIDEASQGAMRLFSSYQPLIGKKIHQLIDFSPLFGKNWMPVPGHPDLYTIDRVLTQIQGKEQPFNVKWFVKDKHSLVCISPKTEIQSAISANSPTTTSSVSSSTNAHPLSQIPSISPLIKEVEPQKPAIVELSSPAQGIGKKLILRENLKILVVDDQEINRIILEKTLKTMGFSKISFAKDGNEATTIFSSNSFDVVFMDMQMPFKNGAEASFSIREYERINNREATPILGWTALTQNEFNQHVESVFKAMPNLNKDYQYLKKPTSKAKIEEALNQFFDFASNASESIVMP